jgi:YfiH family protein
MSDRGAGESGRSGSPRGSLGHPLLEAVGVEHGFGTRGSEAPSPVLVARARQIHGKAVALADARGALDLADADAVVCREPGVAAAVVTADCLPILVCSEDGSSVAAIHAGWRGLAAGVIEAALTALSRDGSPGAEPTRLIAVIGPHIGACCYEVDAPVLDPLRERFGSDVDGAARSTRKGHARLDLAALAQIDLARGGVASADRAVLRDACTSCDAGRFHSYRRDGPRSGRLLHYVMPRR